VCVCFIISLTWTYFNSRILSGSWATKFDFILIRSDFAKKTATFSDRPTPISRQHFFCSCPTPAWYISSAQPKCNFLQLHSLQVIWKTLDRRPIQRSYVAVEVNAKFSHPFTRTTRPGFQRYPPGIGVMYTSKRCAQSIFSPG
jgi:hypothetical protein